MIGTGKNYQLLQIALRFESYIAGVAKKSLDTFTRWLLAVDIQGQAVAFGKEGDRLAIEILKIDLITRGQTFQRAFILCVTDQFSLAVQCDMRGLHVMAAV